MARKVTVEIQAGVSQFKAGMAEAERAAKKLGDAIDGVDGKSLDGATEKTRLFGRATSKTADQVKRDFDEISSHAKRLDTQIRDTEASIKSLSKEFARTGDAGVLKSLKAQQSELRELKDVRGLLPSADKIAAAGRGVGGNLIGGIRAALAGASPAAIGVSLLAGLFAPTVGAAVAGAVVGGAGVGGVIGGVVVASRNEQVKAAGRNLGQFILGDLERRASGFVPATLEGIARIQQGWKAIGPDLDRIFNSSRFVAPLTDGLMRGVQGFASGFADAIENADPVIDSLSIMFDELGTAVGDLFRTMAGDAREGASAIGDLTTMMTSLISVAGGIVHVGAEIKGATDGFDVWLDKYRYWYEDNSKLAGGFKWLGGALDLTADGFKVGTAEALAYRKATLGTAEAADFATLKAAGMSDADIRRADASGTYRAELLNTTGAIERATDASGRYVATQEDLKQAQEASTIAQLNLNTFLEGLGPRAGVAAKQVDALRKATQNLYGAQIASIDAAEGYEASWDSLTESVKKNRSAVGKNKDALDIHTEAGRSNRDALQDLLGKSNEMYFADIAAGKSIDSARKKHEERTEAIRKESGRLGLNRKATQDLIAVYGKIPPKKTTDLVLEGVAAVADALLDLATVQLHLAKGTPLSPALSRKLARAQYGMPDTKRATGGVLPGSAPHDRADNMIYAGTPGEWVIQKPTVRAVEAKHGHGAMAYFNRTGELPHHATGGKLAQAARMSVPADLRFEITATNTKIPSMKDVAAAVFPMVAAGAGGNWPSSPGSQRGDSGVWRSIVALIKSSGIDQGEFGNAYRPGDPKWHGSGRAVDWMGYNMDALATFLAARRPLELIHRTKNRDYAYTRGVNKGSFNEALMNAHRNHIHIAMADGGVINEHVVGVGRSGATYEFGERGPETVVPGYASGGRLVNVAPRTITTPSGPGTGSRLEYLDSLLSAQNAVSALSAALKENGRSFSTATAKGRDNRQSLLSGVRAAQQAAQAKYAETGSLTSANKVYDDYIKRLDAVLKKTGISTKARRELLKTYGERPKFDTTAPDRPMSNSSWTVRRITDQMGAEEALIDVKKAFAWTKPSFNVKTEAGRQELQQLFGFLSAAQQAAQSLYEAGGNAKQATAFYNAYLGQLRTVLSASGMSRKDIDALFVKYGRITLSANRWGGMYERASGGLREAQIASGGPTLYQWAEPETGGEAFIPRNGSREKSLAIWRQVGEQWLNQPVWRPGGGSPAAGGGTFTVNATIPITLGSETITRQVRIEVDAAVGRVVDATVYQTA